MSEPKSLRDYWPIITTGAVAFIAVGAMQTQLLMAGEEIEKLQQLFEHK